MTPEWEARCAECPAVFSQDAIDAEDVSAWGHPCRAAKFRKPVECESFREVWAKTGEHICEGARCSTNHDAALRPGTGAR